MTAADKERRLGTLLGVSNGPNMETLLFRARTGEFVEFVVRPCFHGKKTRSEKIIFRVTGIRFVPEESKEEPFGRPIPKFGCVCMISGYMNLESNVNCCGEQGIIADWWPVVMRYNWHTRCGLIRNMRMIEHFWSPENYRKRQEEESRRPLDDEPDVG